MKKSEWLEFKRNLENLPPLTRLNYLKELLKKEKDKKIKTEIKEEIQETKNQIEEIKIENIPGLPMEGTATAEEITTATISEQPTKPIEKSLDSIVASMPMEEEEEKKQTEYGGKSEYKLSYEGSKTPTEMKSAEEFFKSNGERFETSREPTERYTTIREISVEEELSRSERLKSDEALVSDRIKYKKRPT